MSFDSNFYLDKQIVPTVGTAIMFLNGVMLRLDRVKLLNDTTLLRDIVVYSHALINLYEQAVLNTSKDNILTHQYIKAGDFTVQELRINLQKCSYRLSLALKICS